MIRAVPNWICLISPRSRFTDIALRSPKSNYPTLYSVNIRSSGSLRISSSNIPCKSYGIKLFFSENGVILASVVLSQYIRVTDDIQHILTAMQLQRSAKDQKLERRRWPNRNASMKTGLHPIYRGKECIWVINIVEAKYIFIPLWGVERDLRRRPSALRKRKLFFRFKRHVLEHSLLYFCLCLSINTTDTEFLMQIKIMKWCFGTLKMSYCSTLGK